jgi:hypothetical protein
LNNESKNPAVITERVLRANYGSSDQPLKIGDIDIPCFVLEDGRRVLSQSGLVASLGMRRGGSGGTKRGDRLSIFVNGKGLEPYISRALRDATDNPIKFRSTSGNLTYGYEAQILSEICEAVLAARKAGALQKQQLHIAEMCETLMRGFARVGIIALVDEATGYERVRDKDELQKFLALYLSEERLKWAKMFPDEYYKQLFRLRGWDYYPLSVKRPRMVGKLTNELVYKKLPANVLEELRELNPVKNKKTGRRGAAHFQHLSTEIGQQDLRDHLLQLVAIMKVSKNWDSFKRNFVNAFPSPGDQLELDIDDDDEI